MKQKFGFIGVGNMGGAMARALCRGAGAENVLIYDPDGEKAACLVRETGCETAESAATIASACDFVLLCVKPNMVSGVIENIAPALAAQTEKGARRVIVSIAAGVSIGSISEMLAKGSLRLPIIRLMPNTPLAVGQGMTVMASCPGVSDDDRRALTDALSSGGEVMAVEEKFIDAATPVFSGAPAFVYMFIESLADGGVMAGLPRELSMKLASQAVLGAAAMVKETGKHPGQLKDEVCSPGGSTIVGVEVLENRGFRGTVAAAVYEAYLKTTQLG